MRGKLQDSTLPVWTSGDDTDVCWVVDSCDDAGCEDDLLPVENMLVCSFHCAKNLNALKMLPTRSCQR
jgi:hypothetical protein